MGLIRDIMFSTCSVLEEPSMSDLGAAYAFGMDDGDWCRANNHETTPPKHMVNTKVIEEWRKGYESTRHYSNN